MFRRRTEVQREKTLSGYDREPVIWLGHFRLEKLL